jgi:hypothetical protein
LERILVAAEDAEKTDLRFEISDIREDEDKRPSSKSAPFKRRRDASPGTS